MSKPIELSDIESQEWMERLLIRAEGAGFAGEIPVAAVILDGNGYCIGHGSNKREKDRNPLGHAELQALRQASWVKNDWRFNECTLIVNLEPCCMCAAALIQARMGQVIYGASDLKRGGLGGAIDLSTHKSAHHKMIVRQGVLKLQSEALIKNWFKKQRV